jgi:uncharacterized protein YbbK (DUF523 family)/uncharacterized protein YbgA (DUF1722 family)
MRQTSQISVIIGISSCLLGRRVRYDGGHKREPLITDHLDRMVNWMPICPEMEMGLGTPREPMRLVAGEAGGSPRLITNQRQRDVTGGMEGFIREQLKTLQRAPVDGYIFKKKSPSCGVAGIPLYAFGEDEPVGETSGLFAAAFMKRFPYVPVIEEDTLRLPEQRSAFLQQVAGVARWHVFLKEEPSHHRELGQFHSKNKMILLSHSPHHYAELGRIVADAEDGRRPFQEALKAYGSVYLKTIRIPTTPCKHADVLTHLAGYLKHDLNLQDKEELFNSIAGYRQGELPWSVPAALLRHHLRRHAHPLAEEQTYLQPLPIEWWVRSSV